jgi:hypothetical protein
MFALIEITMHKNSHIKLNGKTTAVGVAGPAGPAGATGPAGAATDVTGLANTFTEDNIFKGHTLVNPEKGFNFRTHPGGANNFGVADIYQISCDANKDIILRPLDNVDKKVIFRDRVNAAICTIQKDGTKPVVEVPTGGEFRIGGVAIGAAGPAGPAGATAPTVSIHVVGLFDDLAFSAVKFSSTRFRNVAGTQSAQVLYHDLANTDHRGLPAISTHAKSVSFRGMVSKHALVNGVFSPSNFTDFTSGETLFTLPIALRPSHVVSCLCPTHRRQALMPNPQGFTRVEVHPNGAVTFYPPTVYGGDSVYLNSVQFYCGI